MSSWEAVVERITTFIQQKVEEASSQGVVIGISGGVDSACTAFLAKRALGSKRVLGVIAPEEGVTPAEDVEDAINLCQSLGIGYDVLKINSIVEAFTETLGEGNRVASANLRPRIRMTVLYFFANSRNMLVAGTGNKTELEVGYFTKYGDGGADILPLGDMYKTKVFLLAESLGVPRKIIEKEPSAGLWRGQTDESEMGLSYQKLDKILTTMEEKGKIDIEGLDRREIYKVIEMVKSTAHKRQMPPVAEVGDLIQ